MAMNFGSICVSVCVCVCVYTYINRSAMYCLNGFNMLGTLINGKRITGQNQLKEFAFVRSHICDEFVCVCVVWVWNYK